MLQISFFKKSQPFKRVNEEHGNMFNMESRPALKESKIQILEIEQLEIEIVPYN